MSQFSSNSFPCFISFRWQVIYLVVFLSLSIIELKFLFNCLNSSSASILGTLTSNAPLLIASDAPIKFIIGFVNLEAKVIAIEVDKNNKK